MPYVPPSPCPSPHDPGWVESLVGPLRLAIPSHWWLGYPGDDTLNDGMIVSINFSKPQDRFYQVGIDRHAYSMVYCDIFLYVNEGHRHCRTYPLPEHPVSNAEGEVFQVQCCQI